MLASDPSRSLDTVHHWDLDGLRRLDFPIVEYHVCQAKIDEYAATMWRAVGRADLAVSLVGSAALPTFAAVFATLPMRQALANPDWVRACGFSPARMLHGEQRYEFLRAIVAGDRLIIQSVVADAAQKRELGLLRVATTANNQHGETVLEGDTTLVLRPEVQHGG